MEKTLVVGSMYDRKELVAAIGEDCSNLTDTEIAKKAGEKLGLVIKDYGPVFAPRYLVDRKVAKGKA